MNRQDSSNKAMRKGEIAARDGGYCPYTESGHVAAWYYGHDFAVSWATPRAPRMQPLGASFNVPIVHVGPDGLEPYVTPIQLPQELSR
jgi:hypothetical protein